MIAGYGYRVHDFAYVLAASNYSMVQVLIVVLVMKIIGLQGNFFFVIYKIFGTHYADY